MNFKNWILSSSPLASLLHLSLLLPLYLSLGYSWLNLHQRECEMEDAKKKKNDLVDTVNLVLAPFGIERCSQTLLSLRGWIFGLPLPISFIIIHFWCWLICYISLRVWRTQFLDRRKNVRSANLVWERFNSPSPLWTSY